MTSSNGNIFRVTGPLCGEFTGPGEVPTQRPVTWSFDVFFDLRLNKRLSKQCWDWWFKTPSRSLWRQCNVIVQEGRSIETLPGAMLTHFAKAYMHNQASTLTWVLKTYIEGILPKGPYLPCVSMVGRALLVGYHRYGNSSDEVLCIANKYFETTTESDIIGMYICYRNLSEVRGPRHV